MMDYIINYSLEKHKPIDIIYLKGLEITQKRIRVFKIENNFIKAIDIDKGVIRTYKKDCILSAMNINYNNEKNIRANIN